MSQMREFNPKKIPTWEEIQAQIYAGTLEPQDVQAFKYVAPPNVQMENLVVRRDRWLRRRPGLYVRLIGPYEVEVEKAEPGENAPEDIRGWMVRWSNLGDLREADVEYEFPAYRDAKHWAETTLVQDERLSNPSAAEIAEKLTSKERRALKRGTSTNPESLRTLRRLARMGLGDVRQVEAVRPRTGKAIRREHELIPSELGLEVLRELERQENPKSYKLTDTKGQSWTFKESELEDTIFEGEAWDSDKMRSRVGKMKKGASIKAGGETLQRVANRKLKAKLLR